jgi:hypothetical protein
MKGYTTNDWGVYISQLKDYPIYLMGGFEYEITSHKDNHGHNTFTIFPDLESAERLALAGDHSQFSKVIDVEFHDCEFDNWAYRAKKMKVLSSVEDFKYSLIKYTEHMGIVEDDELQYEYGGSGELLSYGGDDLLDRHQHLYKFLIKFKYDENGNVLSRVCKYDNDPEHDRETLEYDDKQRIVKMTIDGRDHYKWSYDDLGVYKFSYSTCGCISEIQRKMV